MILNIDYFHFNKLSDLYGIYVIQLCIELIKHFESNKIPKTQFLIDEYIYNNCDNYKISIKDFNSINEILNKYWVYDGRNV